MEARSQLRHRPISKTTDNHSLPRRRPEPDYKMLIPDRRSIQITSQIAMIAITMRPTIVCAGSFSFSAIPENTMNTMDRNQAWETVCEFVKSESLRKHMLSVEACVAAYASDKLYRTNRSGPSRPYCTISTGRFIRKPPIIP